MEAAADVFTGAMGIGFAVAGGAAVLAAAIVETI